MAAILGLRCQLSLAKHYGKMKIAQLNANRKNKQRRILAFGLLPKVVDVLKFHDIWRGHE